MYEIARPCDDLDDSRPCLHCFSSVSVQNQSLFRLSPTRLKMADCQYGGRFKSNASSKFHSECPSPGPRGAQAGQSRSLVLHELCECRLLAMKCRLQAYRESSMKQQDFLFMIFNGILDSKNSLRHWNFNSSFHRLSELPLTSSQVNSIHCGNRVYKIYGSETR